MSLSLPRLFQKRCAPLAPHPTLRLHVPHATIVPTHPPLHASAPMHAHVRLMPTDARLMPADAHVGGDRCARGDRLRMRLLPAPANVAT